MPPKRRAHQSDSDIEDFAEGSQASKRARQSSNDEEDVKPSRSQNRNGKGKGKARAQEDEDLNIEAEEQVEEIVPDADEEKKFEEEHEETIRNQVMNKKKYAQGVRALARLQTIFN